MHIEISRLKQAQRLQAQLDADEYVQQYIVRDYGPPETYRGRQTHQKLEEIIRKCGLSFAGKSFIDLGCNKGFFPMYAAAAGSLHAIGVDPDPIRIKRATEIANFGHSTAEFVCDRFKTDIADRIGMFDIVYVGSAYHYFWLDYRKHFDHRDHEIVFDALAQLTSEVLIFEGCTNLDDEPWRAAVLKTTGSSEAKLRAEFNDDVILGAAGRHFEVSSLGRSGHGTHRFLFVMRKKTSARERPAPDTNFGAMRSVEIKTKQGADRASDVESVSVLEENGRRYIKKVLSNNREWCRPAIAILERSFDLAQAYPRGLCRHYSSKDQVKSIELYQEFITDSVPLSAIPNPRPLRLRQSLVHTVLSMQRDLVTAGLVHIDIHETNILTTKDAIKVIDLEGLIITHSDLYRNRFVAFYTLNFIAFIEAMFNTSVARSTLQKLPGVEMYGANITAQGADKIMECLRGPDEARAVCRAILEEPDLLTNINLYEILLRRLPGLVAQASARSQAAESLVNSAQ